MKRKNGVFQNQNVKGTVLTTFLMMVLLTSPVGMVNASNPAIHDFQDVSKSKWYYQIMDWGVSNGIVAGYKENGTMLLKPEKTVTEAEFLAMIIRIFPNAKSELTNLEHKGKPIEWSDHYYGVAKLFKLPVNGANSPAIRNQPIARGQVAQIIASVFGKNYDINNAIAYLYDTGLSNGRGPSKTISGYEATGLLTRAEAVQFLKVIRDKGLNQKMEVRSDVQETNPNLGKYTGTTPPSPKPTQPTPTQPTQTSTEQKIQEILKGMGEYKEVGVTKKINEQYVRALVSALLKSGVQGNNLVLYLPQNVKAKNHGISYNLEIEGGKYIIEAAGGIYGKKVPEKVTLPYDGKSRYKLFISIDAEGNLGTSPIVAGRVDNEGTFVGGFKFK